MTASATKKTVSLPEKPSGFTLRQNKKYTGAWYYISRDGRNLWIKKTDLLPGDKKLRKWQHQPSPPVY